MVTECRCRKGLGKKGNGLDRLVVAGCSNILKTQTSNLQIFKSSNFKFQNFKFQIFNLQSSNLQSSIFNLQSSIFNLQMLMCLRSPDLCNCPSTVYCVFPPSPRGPWPCRWPLVARDSMRARRQGPAPRGGRLWTYQCERTEDRGPNVSKFRSFEFRVSSFECLSA